MTDPRTAPVIVGVGDLRSGAMGALAPPTEPQELIADAVTRALTDSGAAGIGERVDTVYAVRTACWSYDDLPGLIARRIGARAPRVWTTPIGGHWPAALLDRIGAEIADGTSSVALLVGGEAQASVSALMKQGVDPATRGWLADPGGPPVFTPEDLGSPEMQRAGILAPTQVYPLFENRLGHELGQSPHQSREHSARLYSRFSELAAKHPTAWIPTPRTAESIAVSGPGNRLISDAYPLAMNAMPFVDQAAAVLVCSLEVAIEFGIPRDRIVYLWGGAGAADTADVLAREDFGHSPAMTSAVARTLKQAGVTSGDLGIIDAYSCFPVVPKLLTLALELPDTAVPSVLGGHSFFGGPLNSYTLHAIAEVTRQLRAAPTERPALVHGNGGYLTHQHLVLLARTPHRDGYVGDPEPQALPSGAPPVVHGHAGAATIVTATVIFERDGQPGSGLVIAKTPDGRRVCGSTDAEDAAALLRHTHDGSRSLVGVRTQITDHDGRVAVAIETESDP